MMNLLYVSYCVPFDKAYNAGAQSLNYYINQIKDREDTKIDIVAYCNEKDAQFISDMETKINYHLVVRPKGVSRFIGRITSIYSKYYPHHRYCNLMTRYSIRLLLKRLESLSVDGYKPDVVLLEWTQIVLLVERIKKIFPQSKIIASEPDVTYLSFERKYNNEKNCILKIYKNIQYHNCIKREITALRACDYTFVQSERDKKLVTDKAPELSNLIGIQLPYYHKSALPRNRCNDDILFFGNMGRMENRMAVEWFINNVMPSLTDIPSRFVVLGSGITDELKQMGTDRVVMKGFVDSIDEEFSKAMCFVCPLLLGAGTKVKVLESLYSGIPVLTNSIGIEGIKAQSGIDYIHCEEPEEYANAIREIYKNNSPHINGRALMDRDFCLSKSVESYYHSINMLCNIGGNA